MLNMAIKKQTTLTARDYGDGTVRLSYSRIDPADARRIHVEALGDVMGDLGTVNDQIECMQIALTLLATLLAPTGAPETPSGGDRQ